jgi:hypothetical protein
MGFDLGTIENALSVAVGDGQTGALAAGGAMTAAITELQGDLSAKGQQVGSILGNLGLSGFLQGASQGASKSVTTQARSLSTAIMPNLSRYALYAVLLAVGGYLLYKVIK